MSLRIREKEVSFTAQNLPVGPGKLEHVVFTPSITPFYVFNGSRWLLDQLEQRKAIPDYDDGYW